MASDARFPSGLVLQSLGRSLTPFAVRACVFGDGSPRTASRSKYLDPPTHATVMYEVAGRNLSPNAPTGGFGRHQAIRLRTRHGSISRPVYGLRP